ncbi:MAG: BPSS1780 family membrane protein, partial [Burkholderiales bacterium]
WFAPPLAAWHATGAPKALFFSFFACLMNWRAFLAYGAITALVALVLPFLVLSILMLASLKAPVMALVFPILLLLLPTLFASFYVSYRDVFGAE